MTNSIKSLKHKKHRNLSASEIRETEINLVELEKGLKFKKNCIYSDEYKKIRRVTRLIKYPSIKWKRHDNCFQYAITVALSHQNIGRNLQRILEIKSFFNQYNWKEIHFPSHEKDWKKFEQNNKTITLNILFIPHNTEEIRHVYKSKHNYERENQVILLMITDGEKWHYLTLKKYIRWWKTGQSFCIKFV